MREKQSICSFGDIYFYQKQKFFYVHIRYYARMQNSIAVLWRLTFNFGQKRKKNYIATQSAPQLCVLGLEMNRMNEFSSDDDDNVLLPLMRG